MMEAEVIPRKVTISEDIISLEAAGTIEITGGVKMYPMIY